ncbi:putative polyketide synthase [Whalleya microplaca]|nr:putative polyketide synthase [Whalleya microplaca]
MDGQSNEPIAIVGSACRFSGSASSPAKLWELLTQPRDVRQEILDSRFSARGFYHPDGTYHGHSNVTHAYFLNEDPGAFDAEFFGIRPVEAKALDPQQRILLEVVYEALEAAGLPVGSVRGSDTAVYVGSMSDDYGTMLLRDIQDTPTYYATGAARSILSNRISYFFDWHGPSVSIDTACSSSLVAVHMALQALRASECRMALACGTNLILGPENFVIESKLGMLSPDGRGRMWDQGANGYARGDGVATLILKTVRAALEDGDNIECIIRETGLNQDGSTTGITMPSAAAQAALIRRTYARAGLNLLNYQDRPQFFEAHGTGTPAGDPIEAEAIHSVFGSQCGDGSGKNKVYVGSIKTVLGHTEGAAGVAAVLKACLALQNRCIPPNLLFEHLNDRIAPFYKSVEIPLTVRPWPDITTGRRRASVNSFGFGGANAHAILESFDEPRYDKAIDGPVFTPFIFSAFSESSLDAVLRDYAQYLHKNREDIDLHDLAWTLRQRRSVLGWRTSIAASSLGDLRTKILTNIEDDEISVGIKALPEIQNSVLGIFTGQGAQYVRMGAELIKHSEIARTIIQRLESHLRDIPDGEAPDWSLSSELLAESSSRVHEAAVSQPLCTAIQILLVDLLRLSGVRFDIVVGHSSGEISAAYAAGFLTARDAMLISYYRGLHLQQAFSPNGADIKGAMLAVGTSPEDAAELCADKVFKDRIVLAAANSPSSATVSGDEDAILELEEILEDEGIFHRRLKVDKAYHSPHMLPCFDSYVSSLRRCGIRPLKPEQTGCIWISSVYDGPIHANTTGLSDVYWADNMTRPVLFSQAISRALAAQPCGLALEIGPNPALKGPASSTIISVLGKAIPYHGTLMRETNAIEAMSSAFGYLWSHLGPSCVDLDGYERKMAREERRYRLVKGLPTYRWNHDTRYWHESRASRKMRKRPDCVHPLLGHISTDSAPHHLSWKHLLRVGEIQWLAGHQVQGQVVFPAAGYVCTAMEAARFTAEATSPSQGVQLIKLRDFVIHQAIAFEQSDRGIEIFISMADISRQRLDRVKAHFTYSAAISSQEADSLALVASCQIEITLGEADASLLSIRKASLPHMIDVEPERFYAALSDLGYDFVGSFRSLSTLRRKHCRSSCLATTGPLEEEYKTLLIHPTELDASLQSIMLAHSYPYDEHLRTIHLPTTIRQIMINPEACIPMTRVQDASVSIDAAVALRKEEWRGITGHANIYRGSSRHAVIQVQGASFMPLGGAAMAKDRKVFSKVNWILSRPDGSVAVHDIALAQDHGVTVDLLERIAVFYLKMFDREVAVDHTMRSQSPTSNYLNFARHVATIVDSGKHKWAQKSWLQDTLENIVEVSKPFSHCPDVQIMHLVGAQMPRVFNGEGTMLEYFRANDNDILDRYYAGALGLKESAHWVSRSVKQVVDRHRHMNILEIGAGTGGATKAVLKEIDQSFLSYTYTDVSAAFFENASSTFLRHKDRIIFKTLDVEKDPIEQGYIEGAYDLIICFFVLHATGDVSHCLRNIRKLLKPGGFLVVGEGQDAWDGMATMGFIFGTLPGWWVGRDAGRILSPYIPPRDWNRLLQTTGFSGVDTSPPKEFQESYSVYHFVSQAVDNYVQFLREPLTVHTWPLPPIKKLVIVGGLTSRTSRIVTGLRDILVTRNYATDCHFFPTLSDINYQIVDVNSTVISLTELDYPTFKGITPDGFTALKRMFETGKTLLWITSGRLENEPFSNMTIGFGRVAANETPDLRLQQLDIANPASIRAETIAEILLRFHATAGNNDKVLWTVEPEIIIDSHGYELLSRLEHVPELNDRYNSCNRPIVREVDLNTSPTLVVLQPESGSFVVRDLSCHNLLTSETDSTGTLIELRTKSSTLSAVKTSIGHRFVVLATHPDTGSEYITLVSTSVLSSFKVPQGFVVPRPTLTNLSDDQILSIVCAHLVAIEVLNLPLRGQTIVAHNAPDIVAQALGFQAAQKSVNVVFTTDFKGNTPDSWIRLPQYMTQSDVEETLLPAKLSSFIGFSRDGTQSSDNEATLMECLKGRCQSFTSAKMLYSLTGSDPGTIPTTMLGDVMSHALEFVQQAISSEQERHGVFPQSIRLNSLVGGVQPEDPLAVVDWTNTGLLPVNVSRLDSKPMFKGNGSTYWIVGISRALGISLADWFISNGVTHLVITSREPEIDPEWIAAHKRKGANVCVLPCDITDESRLQDVHRHICATLPRIVGVVQGAMVLHDTLLRNMSYEQLRKVVGPKVDGSVHLDRIFHDTDLDFFVLVSSINCVIGNMGQANYAAANTFMCGLAAQRRKRGLRAAAVNGGAIIGAGYMVRESRKELDSIVERYHMLRLSEEDWCQSICEAIDACRLESPHGPELTTSLSDVALDIAKAPNAPNWCSDPKFSPLIIARAATVDKEDAKANITTSEQLRQCQSEEEVYRVVESALATQLRVVLQVSTADHDLMSSRSNEIGLDSLVAVDIRSWFLKYLQVNIPVLRIMGNNTMASLVQLAVEGLPSELAPIIQNNNEASGGLEDQSIIDSSSEKPPGELSPSKDISSMLATPLGTSGPADSLIDWRSESRPPADMAEVIPDPSLNQVHFPPRVIVLTGSTGLLGHHLLSHILSQPTVEKIICLAVRSLASRLQQGRLPEDHRIVYHEGDLAQPLLGLSEDEAESTFADADVVIHNGADTSHLKHYIDLRAANVGSTIALARLCLRRHIPLHYVSSAGLGIFHENCRTEGFPAGPINLAHGKTPDGSFGYACSKLTCEMFLEQMSEKHRMRVFIHRPSTIVREGDDAVGLEAERDWVNALMTYVKKSKAAPKAKGNLGALDLVSVRSVCEGIIGRAFNSNGSNNNEEGVTYIHEVGDKVVPLDKLQDLGLQEQGEPYTVLPWEEWMTTAISAGLHPGVAALIDSMDESAEQYPKILKGGSSS